MQNVVVTHASVQFGSVQYLRRYWSGNIDVKKYFFYEEKVYVYVLVEKNGGSEDDDEHYTRRTK